MWARIPDGYTRHVGIGDGTTVPEVEFRYRPVRGGQIQEHIHGLAISKDAEKFQRESLAGQVKWWEAEGFDESAPTAELFAELDGLAFAAMYAVVFSGAAPGKVFDRDEPRTEAEQIEEDAKN